MSVARHNRQARLIAGQITGHLLPAVPCERTAQRDPDVIAAEVDRVNALRAAQPSLSLLEAIRRVQREMAKDAAASVQP